MVEDAEESGEEKTVKQEKATAMPLSLSELSGNVDVYTDLVTLLRSFYLERF